MEGERKWTIQLHSALRMHISGLAWDGYGWYDGAAVN